MAGDGKNHEIVIIRRGGHGDHDEHHGGVWKIAFADFMTAMMAFFLVMWLISANDKTRASVARYFNPVRLVDATTQPRGLHDTKKDESGITASPDTKKPDNNKAELAKSAGRADRPNGNSETAKGNAEKASEAPVAAGRESPAQKEKRLDDALRDNPMAALAEIAAAKGPGDNASRPVHPAPPVIGRRGGEAFRDPFAPPPPALDDKDDGSDAIAAPMRIGDASPPQSDRAQGAVKTIAQPGKPAADNSARIDAQAKALADALKPASEAGRGPKVDVRHTSDGLLLSLTDTKDFAMFSNGSAVPSKRVVLMMEGVAKVIGSTPGRVIVRGYTDNKRYRSGRYDNWHLSLDRAQVAHYMLVRGGLDDARFDHVEGYADRAARPGTDAASPLNRRIEILIKEPGR